MTAERRAWGERLLAAIQDRSLPAEERAAAEKEFWAGIEDYWEKDRAMWKAIHAHIGVDEWKKTRHRDLLIARAKTALGYELELNPWDRRVLEAAS
jgi:hypothetical protein